MRIPNFNKALLWNPAPFALCCFLIYVPYFLFTSSHLFNFDLKHDHLEHAVYGLLPIAVIIAAVLLGGTNKLSYAPEDINHFDTPRGIRALVLFLLCASLITQVAHSALGTLAYMVGGYRASREVLPIEGIGVILRLDIFLLPLYAAISRSKKLFFKLFLVSIITHITRAFVMSERVAINEIIYISMVALPYAGIYGINLKKLIAAVTLAFLFFSLTLQNRLDQQSLAGSKFDSNSTTFLESVGAYYADTTNKYYLALAGDIKYPDIQILKPAQALVGGNSTNRGDFANYLHSVEQATGAVSTGLNNPGGLAQDISDFGVLGLLAVFIKFTFFSLVWSRRFKSPVFLAVSPLILFSVVEYPRFNYLSLPFGFFLLVIAAAVGSLISVYAQRIYNAKPIGLDHS